MGFATIWTTSAKDLIRDVLIQDINGDDAIEVVYSSWDGNIYAVQGSGGTRVWTLKSNRYSGPAEHLTKLNLSSKEKYIAATKHKYLLIINGKNGKIEFAENFGSWIKEITSCDFDCDGRSEIALLTRKNEFYVLDDDGEIVFRKTLTDGKTILNVPLSTLKQCVCPNIVVCKSGLAPIKRNLDSFLKERRFNSTITAIYSGMVFPDLTYGSIVGLKNEIRIIDNSNIDMRFRDKTLLPHIIRTGDVDGDVQEEIIIGNWNDDSIAVLKIKDESVTKLFNINVGGNPVNIECADIDGDGKDEILAFIDKPENNFIIIDPYTRNKIIYTSDTYPASLGLKIDNVLGFGYGDILYRSGREKISLLIHVPRISAPKLLKEGENFNVDLITQAKDKLLTSREIEISSKKVSSTRMKLDIGWVTMSRVKGKSLSHGVSWIKLQKGKRNILHREINIASKRKITLSTAAIHCLEEDVIKLDDKIVEVSIPDRYRDYISIKRKSDDPREYYVAVKSNSYLRVVVKLRLRNGKEKNQSVLIMKEKAIKCDLFEREYYFYRDNIEMKITNLSPSNLRLTLVGDELINVPEDQITLPPRSLKKINLNIIYEPERYVETVHSSIKVVYTGLMDHCIQIPLELHIVNDKKIKALVEEIARVKSNIENIYEAVSTRTNLPIEIIKKAIQRRH